MRSYEDLNLPIYPFIPCLEGEIWKELTDREANLVKPYYMISNKGRIFNIYTGKILSMVLDSKGYWFYNLRAYTKTGCRCYRAHRMLMLKFHYIEGCEDLEIDHIDTNKQNLNENNFRWCTHVENGLYSYQNGHSNPKGEDRPYATITNEQAEQICQRITSGEEMQKIANDMNINKDLVYSISSHKAWNHISCNYDFSNKHKSQGRPKRN